MKDCPFYDQCKNQTEAEKEQWCGCYNEPPEWVYDKDTQKAQALRAAGYTAWETLGDVNRYGWAKIGVEWSERITRFTSRTQAIDYAYRTVIQLNRAI